MQAKQQIISRTENNERILEFIKLRNENFKNSPTKMIDSCLERNRKAIVLDRIMVQADTPNQHLELVPDEIKRQTASHFQNIAGSTNRDVSNDNSPNFNSNWNNWERHYEPIEAIDNDCYSGIMDIPTYDDWLLTLKHLPDHKAPGPSKITNEMLKKLGPKMNRFLYTIICACFISSFTPLQWNLAYVYLIPKPKSWNCKLDNTRPITLLDTVRKAFVKILNHRLQNVFIKNNILKGLNFAGLPHQSTMDPLHIVNNILEYHRLNKKFDKTNHSNLYILFQDMSKAYDRVNIYMLRKAMARLKIPFEFTNVITNLFLNRKNSVFTAYGNTDPYDVIVGIDQGEVISPLLWVIYYDPLLSRIQKSNYGYKMSVSWQPDITKTETSEISAHIPNSAYMDNTIWITDSITNLTAIFDIAQSFFDLNSMKVNNDKSFILTSEATEVDISIFSEFLNQPISFPTKKPSESTRYLGV